MRRLVAAFALLSASCSPTAPSPSLAGTWAQTFAIPGASLILTIDASGNGNGTYTVEAGRSGVVQVTGSVAQATVVLTIQYDSGTVRKFTGSLSDVNHLTGAFDDSAGTVVFTRR